MPDGKVILIAGAIGLAIWGGAWVGHKVKVGAKKTGCALERVAGKHCAAPTQEIKPETTI